MSDISNESVTTKEKNSDNLFREVYNIKISNCLSSFHEACKKIKETEFGTTSNDISSLIKHNFEIIQSKTVMYKLMCIVISYFNS